MSPGFLLTSAFAAASASLVVGARYSRTWLALVVCAAAATLAAAFRVLLGTTDWEWRSNFAIGGEAAHLRLDGVSAVFLVLLCVVAAAGAVYGREYWSDAREPGSAPRGRIAWSAMVLNMGLALLCSNGLHFLVAWELFTLSAYFLIRLDDRRRPARSAAWLYLAASHVASLCLFAFFGVLAARTGSWDLGPMLEHAELAPLFWLVLLGFGVKAGFFPLHVWLPSAHSNAPSHVSGILSGVAIKMGIYGIVRFSGWLVVPPGAGWVVLGLGAGSALVGITFAFAQNDLKRLLAYCSVEHVGVILIGVGGALLAVAHDNAAWGRLALAGALLHVWNHGAFKALLFFCSGSVVHATGTREMSRLGGLWRAMPWTATLFALAAIAVAGLPPLNGFVSEWLLYLGLFDAAALRSAAAWAVLPVAIVLAMAGALALATFVKAGTIVFFGAPRTQVARHAHECGPLMRGPMLVLAGACIALALAPAVLWPALARAVGAWNPAWIGAEPPAALDRLGWTHVVLAGVAVLVALVLVRRVRANGTRRGPTWDCGFAEPTPRMQYTSGAFAGIVGGWSAWLLRTESRYRRPRGAFPARSERVERVPEMVLEHVLAPTGGALVRVALAARKLQHGRLQAYILYLVLGLAGVALIVYFGGAP
ncbi:MAG: NADH-quinone oxidoreductase subunit H [Planctomycetes bacterium]|nr:NADH-quinone oxidoreductase subunit H [Planctomycetota bacterium]